LKKTFEKGRESLKIELQKHIASEGRISLTTDCWSARNYKDFIAITVHWINSKWEHKSYILEVLELQDPVHSGAYMTQLLLQVTNDFGITNSIFTVTRNNASPNNVILNGFKEEVEER
jgi:hypothetical protein